MNEPKLDEHQLRAVKHDKGPLLIVAGAGTGKTTVITERIKHLVLDLKVDPAKILALTFTEKAAIEMEERVDKVMPYGVTSMWISTFHSFCDRVLRNESLHIGLNPTYKLMSQAETILLLRQNIFKFDLKYFRPLGNPNKFLESLLSHFSRLKDEDISPTDYLKYVKTDKDLKKDPEEYEKYLELSNAYSFYEELKAKESVMDFSDLISNTLKLFRKRPNVLSIYQKQFDHVLVDEFQDTNYAQNELAIMIAGEKRNITVVGDDDQCLPGDVLIATPNGDKKIMDIKKNDEVYSGVGKGSIAIEKVNQVMKNKKTSIFITIKTKNGQKLTATSNHKMFCYVPMKVFEKNYFYVYLMYRKNLGWRLGITRDLAIRLKLERSSDAIVGLRAFQTQEEARYYELLWALKYQIPTSIFKERDGVMMQGELLEKLYKVFDTEANAHLLAKDLGINLENYHYLLDAVTRGKSRRIKINLYLCVRNYVAKNSKNKIMKNPSISHIVILETSNKNIIRILKKNNINLEKAKKGMRVRFYSADIDKVSKFAKKLSQITGGFIEAKSTIGRFNYQHLPALIMPAGNLLEGHYVPILKNNKLIYDQIIEIKREEKTDYVYDLEINRTHNFIANGISVHNSIYRFRGSSVSNIIQFKNKFKQTKVVSLINNYRSTKEILNSSYELIQNNNPDRLEVKENINKKLVSVRNIKGEKIEFIFKERVEDEASDVANKIADLVGKKKYDFKDFALLVRANEHSSSFIRAFERKQIPFQFLGPGRLFHQEEIKDLIAYLKVLYNFEDSASLYRIINMKAFGLNSVEIASLLNLAKRKNYTLFEALDKSDETVLSNETKEKVKYLHKIIKKHLGLVPKETAGQILYYFLEDTGLIKKLIDYKTQTDEKIAKNIAKFFDKLKTYEIDHVSSSVFDVVDWIELSQQMGESPLATDLDWTENNAVNILTVHSSKGLEFPVVFLVNLVANRFPTRERSEKIPIPQKLIKEILPTGDYHLEEERRLFYVGMTRARDQLFFSAANFYGGGKRERKISQFVLEALGEEVLNKTKIKENEKGEELQLSLLDWAKKDDQESKPIASSTPITYLSYSQLQTFDICPLHYKLKYILKIPSAQSFAQSFGTSIHSVLRDFYETQVSIGEKLSLKDIDYLIKKDWINEGYSSKKHEEVMLVRAKKIITDYLSDNFDKNNLPLKIEYPFIFDLKGIRIGGRIDRIDNLKDNKIEVIDYKTGENVPSQKDLAKNKQLGFYALAASEINDPTFKRNAEDIILSLVYLDKNIKISTSRTSAQLEEEKEFILSKAKEISESDFDCSRSELCKTCEYKILCRVV